MSCIILSAGWLAVLWACAGGNGLRGNGSRAEPELLSLPSAENNGKTHVIEPQLEQCTLEVGRRVLKPIRTVTPWRYEHRIADWRISVDKDTVSARRGSKTQPDWVGKSADGHHLKWMTSDGTTAYLVS